MNAVGIIIARENSKRFPGKNYYEVEGMPMFAHNLQLLLNCNFIKEVFIATDSKFIKDFCWYHNKKDKYQLNQIGIIDRGINIIDDNQSFFEVLKFAYQSINEKYGIIASILANTIGHTQEDIDRAMRKIHSDCNEIRSFDRYGNETGILVFKEHVILNQPCISSHLGAVFTKGKEIHFEEDLYNESDRIK
jgi:CMP-N-acetylneuraminic acid synthetase